MRIIIALLLFSFSNILHAQDENSMHLLIKNGDAPGLSAYFGKSVELSLNETDGIYSKKQAELILKDFFDKNKANNYEIKHEGGNLKKSKFSIGTYQTSEATYRSHLLFRMVDNKLQIIELRFELED